MARNIYKMLKDYSIRHSLHMPAHNGVPPFDYEDIFPLDATELSVTDNLYVPQNGILNAEKELAKSAKAQKAILLHNGSTAGIQAMIMYAKHFSNKIIIPRNAHLSVYNICAILNMEVHYIEHSKTSDGHIYISSQNAMDAIYKFSGSGAILLCSPDYYGLAIDLKQISELAHNKNMLVLCDQAHGAHFNWYFEMKNAGEYGADIFVQSAHKTLPALGSCAWLLHNSVDEEILMKCLQSLQSSSPSFINMLSSDDAREYMDNFGKNNILELKHIIRNFGDKIQKLGYSLSHDKWKKEIKDKNIVYDETRLVIDCPQGGFKLKNKLSNDGIDVEMADLYRIVCILPIYPQKAEKLLDLLYNKLVTINKEANNVNDKKININPRIIMPMNKAYFSNYEWIDIDKATGRVSAGIVGLYPPGVPLIVWGEEFNDNIIHIVIQSPKDELFGVKNNKVKCVKL